MAGELEQLKAILPDDLQRYANEDDKLQFAIDVAISQINARRKHASDDYEPKYRTNVLRGAVWWLGKQGAEGYSGTSENGVSVNWQEIPDWLAEVIPKLGVF